ncbi:MAG: GtrA family protein [Bacteroidales bacterium]|nr:GtrA family protein [Bacteroidales bacterium]
MEQKRKQFIRYLIVGTIATIIQYGVYYLLINILNPSISYSIGFILSFFANYLLTTYFTFEQTSSWRKLFGFAGQQAFNYLFQLSFLNLFLYIGVQKELAPFPVFAIALPLNFLILRLVFGKKRK